MPFPMFFAAGLHSGRNAIAALGLAATFAAGTSALAQASPAPTATPTAAPSATPAPTPAVAPPAPSYPAVQSWTIADARALLAAVRGIGTEGLLPADYQPDALDAAIAGGTGAALDEQASRSFRWLVEDLRDGRTPMRARVQWFVDDKDWQLHPTNTLLWRATTTHDVAGALATLTPAHPDYTALKAELAATPSSDRAKISALRANMDRWRWLEHDLGMQYLITNVPEFELRLVVRDQIITTYRTVVGKPGRTATPQLAETVEAIIFNPTWTVPQSIVVGEGLGRRLLANPASARRQGYAVTRNGNNINVVQQPGPQNALGLMKLDMPNEHAIFLHDTPSRGLFNAANRALSHGCIRTERASELAITMAILGANLAPDEGVAHTLSGKYTRVPMTNTFPVYITYFTMGRNAQGQMRAYADIYGRDAPVLASFNAPRVAKVEGEKTREQVIVIDKPGA